MLKDQAIDDRHSRLASNERNIVAFRASIENHRRYWEKLNADEEKGDWTRIVMDRLEFQIKWDESWLAQCADSEVRLRGEISGLKEEKRIMEREGEGIRKQIAEMKAA